MRLPKNFKTEAIAGVTTFFTMAYIVVVNPSILSSEGTGMPFGGVLTATVLLSFLMTLLMGVYAKLPFAVAPGMGINAFFTFSLILGKQIPWPTALGLVFWAGVIFILISVTPLREQIARAIPAQLRIASATGIGIFLTFIGLKNAGLVTADSATLVRMGKLTLESGLCLMGVGLSAWLLHRRSKFAFLISIFGITGVMLIMGKVTMPSTFFAWPDFKSVLFKLDILGALKPIFLPAILSILFTDLFDSISTFVGVAHATQMLDKNGEPKNLREGLVVDAVATLGAGLLGTSSGTAYIESAAGIEMGGRTGLTSVVTAVCFLPCLFLAPLAGMVPTIATAPVLILVGALMFKSVSGLKLDRIEDTLPAFLIVILIPLTFSITQGILWGFVSHTALYFVVGRQREVSPALTILSLLSAGLLWIEYGA